MPIVSEQELMQHKKVLLAYVDIRLDHILQCADPHEAKKIFSRLCKEIHANGFKEELTPKIKDKFNFILQRDILQQKISICENAIKDNSETWLFSAKLSALPKILNKAKTAEEVLGVSDALDVALNSSIKINGALNKIRKDLRKVQPHLLDKDNEIRNIIFQRDKMVTFSKTINIKKYELDHSRTLKRVPKYRCSGENENLDFSKEKSLNEIKEIFEKKLFAKLSDVKVLMYTDLRGEHDLKSLHVRIEFANRHLRDSYFGALSDTGIEVAKKDTTSLKGHTIYSLSILPINNNIAKILANTFVYNLSDALQKRFRLLAIKQTLKQSIPKEYSDITVDDEDEVPRIIIPSGYKEIYANLLQLFEENVIALDSFPATRVFPDNFIDIHPTKENHDIFKNESFIEQLKAAFCPKIPRKIRIKF